MKYEFGDTLINHIGNDFRYNLILVTEVREKTNEYYGNTLFITESGVHAHFNDNLEYDLEGSVPIPRSFYHLIVSVVERALWDATSLIKRTRHKPASHLEVESCYVYLSVLGRWAVNRVKYFEAISDDTPGVHEVEILEEEGGEVHSETLDIGNLTFDRRHSFILREVIDEKEDFIISKKTYSRICLIHSQLVEDLMTLLELNHLQLKSSDGKYGYYDPDRGNEIACQWKDALPFSEGLAAVANEKGKYGYIDIYGLEAVHFFWKSAQSFSDGLAAVMDMDNLWGYIDRGGQLVIPCEWTMAESFHNGVACVRDADGRFHIIDKQGQDIGIL